MAPSKTEWVQPAQGGRTFGVANLTNDSTVRDWANYHNTDCWSPDGRYICFTRFASNGEIYGTNEAAEVHITDTHTGESQRVDNGLSPRWANRHNWLFYVRYVDGPLDGEGTEVWWWDLETDRKALIACGVMYLGETSYDDRFLFGYTTLRDQDPPRKSYRMQVKEGGKREYLPGMDRYYQWIPNPCHNVVFARTSPDRREEPFSATRYWCNVDGKDIQVGSPFLEQCHQGWLGNGAYFLLGNSQVRGRKWNEPFPSSLHFLANVSTGDVSACGKSGRFVTGDNPMTIADLRSGDGWAFLEDLSIICYPSHIGDNSGPYDCDPKGSPDGTKVCFVSTYDLKSGPVTFITRSADETADRVEVESTDAFPDSGEFVVFREVIGYTHKTETSFEGLTRKLYDTSGFGGREYSPLNEGEPVTPFEARCHPEEVWKTLPKPAGNLQNTIGSLDSPLIRQKSADVYAAVVRKPDRPYLREADGEAELVPGESHYETFGYLLFRDGQPIHTEPVSPGTVVDIEAGGTCTAVAVEWCGVESEPSNGLKVEAGGRLRVHLDAPADFSWTFDRWVAEGQEVNLSGGLQSADAAKEVHHLYDGVIAREWYNWGTITARHDLNGEGKATRRLTYHQGHLFCRKYYTADDRHLSTEVLDVEGNVTEMILYRDRDGKGEEYDHWWFEKGMPERRIGKRPARRIDSEEPVMYLKSGEKWVLQDFAGRRPTEAEVAAHRWYGETGEET